MSLSTRLKTSIHGRAWPGAVLLLAAIALAVAPAAQAADTDPSTITVYAPGAAVGAPVGVQQQVGSRWVALDSWQGSLVYVTYRGVPFETLTVDPADYGQGPFRWVVYSLDGQSVYATSEPFMMPGRGGIDLDQTIGPFTDPVGLPANPASTTVSMPAPAVAAPTLKATESVWDTFCHAGDCASAQISTYITGLPVSSWIAVEWLDLQGFWRPVENWEGPPDLVDPPEQLMYKAWRVMPSIYGRGPFRWAIYSGPNGGILGVSPSFNLPAKDRMNVILYLSP